MIIGLIGNARSGKDIAAKIIIGKGMVKGLKRYAFADPIKECVNALFGWDHRHADGSLKEGLVPCTKLDVEAFEAAMDKYCLPKSIGNCSVRNKFLTELIIAHERAGHTIPNWYVPRIAYQIFGTETCRKLMGGRCVG